MELPKLRLPNLNASGLQTGDKFNLLGDYLLTMERNLRFVLSHLEEDNFSEGVAKSFASQTEDAQSGAAKPAEVDPTVPEWAKQESPPTYTEVDPTVPEWAKRPNPPTYTAADVGAAPATISSGVYRVSSETELETTLNDVLSGMPDNAVKYIIIAPANTSMGFGSAMLTEVYRRTAEYVTVRMNGYGSNNTYMLCKTKWANVWKPLAWINPPMTLGVEYRTTEMYNGKPIYTMMCVYAPSNFTATRQTLPTLATWAETITIYVRWYDSVAGAWRNFPSVYHGNIEWMGQVFSAYTSNLTFEIGAAMLERMRASTKDVYVTLRYVKEAV